MLEPGVTAKDIGGRRPFRDLLAWYRPYLRGSRGKLTVALVLAVVVLACQAVIPLQVDSILHHGEWDSAAIAVLGVLIVIQIVGSHGSHLQAHAVANESGERLRLNIFAHTLRSRVLRQEGLVRSSIVSRHTSDVDHVSEGFESTIAQGLPGVVRVLQSLILLSFLEWRAGVVMTIATIAFLIVRGFVGRGLLVMDRQRLSTSSRVGESVDEAITGSRVISGLHLDGWMDRRFARRAHQLTHATHKQAIKATQLTTGAHATGLLGLFAVVIFAIVLGGDSLASVAAALLYVEGVVAGLEALPGWIRSLQLAVVSRHRIDMILHAPTEPDSPRGFQMHGKAVSELRDFTTRPRHLVGLVTPAAVESDAVLASISTADHPDPWRVNVDGQVIRMPDVGSDILHVPQESSAFNASVYEHVRALAPDLSDADADAILQSVGLSYLRETGFGFDRPLGPTGAALTVNERQRLALATALAARPRVLLVGPIIALSDADTALPLVAALRASDCQTVVVSARSQDVAAAMDSMVFATTDAFQQGSHEQLLVDSPDYARIWGQRLLGEDVDLSVLGLGESAEESLYARLVTERYDAGEVIYRQGATADRIVFVISGHVEISIEDEGRTRRVAVLGPGNHCGDLRLTVGERRAESAHALDTCVVRSLSRDAISAGLTGLLDRTATERRIVSSILRSGPATTAELQKRLPDVEPGDLARSLALLVQDGAVRQAGDTVSVVLQRSSKAGARELLDRLGDF